jgi:hypothetical protein
LQRGPDPILQKMAGFATLVSRHDDRPSILYRHMMAGLVIEHDNRPSYRQCDSLYVVNMHNDRPRKETVIFLVYTLNWY